MELLKLTCEQEKEIFKLFKTTESDIKESVEIIKEWMQKQPHLPTDLTDDFIRRILIRNKFRIERTKEKLDNYFSLRGHHQDLTSDYQNLQPSNFFLLYTPIPKITPNFERVIIVKLINTNVELYDFQELLKLCLATTELNLEYDNSIAVSFIFDFSGFTIKHFLKWNPILLYKSFTLLEKAYSCRISSILMLNAPDFFGKVLGMMKLILPPKIYDRIKICDNISQLTEFIPVDCLPAEYGGTCSNFPDLLKQWDQAFKTHYDFFVKNSKRVSLENLRPLEMKTNSLYGPDGSFKQLTFD